MQVVIIDFESKSKSLKRRHDAICKGFGLSLEERAQLRNNLKVLELRRYIADGNQLPRFPGGKQPDNGNREYWEQLIKAHPADLYIIDPMRCLHSEEENDSHIESLLSVIRSVFKKAAVVIAHHMTKRGSNKEAVALKDDMRMFSDGARGSGALKAHADVIVCQERTKENDIEVVYWGAFLKDAADIEPMALEETGHETFVWTVRAEVPSAARPSYDALKQSGKTSFATKRDACGIITAKTSAHEKTAYRHISQLIECGALRDEDGVLKLRTDFKTESPRLGAG
jgi:hypothetical protein